MQIWKDTLANQAPGSAPGRAQPHDLWRTVRSRRGRAGATGGGAYRVKKRLPLDGIRVLDFGWIFAVPYATAWLGALGAEVIRVESMRAPDLVRFLTGTDGRIGPNLSGVFHSINFSRKSLALDLSRPEAQEIARRLVQCSDIVTENFTVGNMQKYGLDYESI